MFLMEDKYYQLIVNNQKLVDLLKKQQKSLEMLRLSKLKLEVMGKKRGIGDDLGLSFKSVDDISKLLEGGNGYLLSLDQFLDVFSKKGKKEHRLKDIFKLYSNKEGYSSILGLTIGLSFFSRKVKINHLVDLFGDEIDRDDFIYLLEEYFKMIYYCSPILLTIEEEPKNMVLSIYETYLEYSGGKMEKSNIVSWLDYYHSIYHVSDVKIAMRR